MKNSFQHSILALTIGVYAALCYLLHPWLAYIIDSDGVAYLTIAKRVANHQYLESINGLWSPLNSWLLVPFIQHGFDAWLVSKALNCFFGGIVIVLFHFLLQQFKIQKLAYACSMLASSVVLVHCIYLQMFGDVLQLIFIMLYLLVLWSKQFNRSIWYAALCGLLMGIGFYAKTYTLIFFLLHFAVSLYWRYHQQIIQKRIAIQQYLIGCLIIFMMVIPWTFALHQKYGIWSITGTAGKLNMSWYINSGKTFKDDIKLLIPPTYHDSPSFWEDPYPSQTNLSSPFSSAKHFVKWIARVVHTCLTAITCYYELSFLALAIFFLSFYFFFFKKSKQTNYLEIQMQLLLLTVLLLPLGYLMMHIETRYIWLNGFLLTIAGIVLLQQFRHNLSSYIYSLGILMITCSFTVFPLLDLKNLMNKNKDLFEIANELNQHQIHGKFTSNGTDGGRMWVVAYLTKNSFFTIERTDYSMSELIAEMKRYEVKYYVYENGNNQVSSELDPSNFNFIFHGNGFDVYALK